MNIVQIQNRMQGMPNTPQTMQYLNAAMNGQVATVPPYIAAAELKRRESEGMMEQLAKGAAQGPQATVKDQLEQKAGIMALMGQQQPAPRPQIPQPGQPQAQPEAQGGIDQLPVKGDMFGMAGGGIVAFNGEERSDVPEPYETEIDRLYRKNREEAERRAREAQAAGEGIAAKPGRPVMRRLEDSGLREDLDRKRRLQQEAQMNVRLAQGEPYVDPRIARAGLGATPPEETVGTMGRAPGILQGAAAPRKEGPTAPTAPRAAAPAAAQDGIKSLLAQAEADPAFKRLMEGVNAKNPYAEAPESQADYIKRMTEGIRGQMASGKMPWETSEERLKGIEARRAKEDADYKASTTGEGRKMDNLITMLTNMGAGSFGQGGSQGVRAVQALERGQREEALKRQDMRDQQDQKMAEIRSLNDAAEYARATGNMTEFNRLQQDIKKLKAEFDKDQASLAKGAAQVTSGAREKDLEAKIARERMAKDLQVANTYTAARGDRGAMTEAQIANIRAKAVKDVEAELSKDFRKRQEIAANPGIKDKLVQDRINFILQQGYTEGSPSPAPAAGGNTRMRFDAQGNPIK